jgi:methylphosphotriester-DNA--protein-cysteine methyltransferase
MKRENRAFFISEKEAIEKGYRPCSKCMYDKYKNWKNGIV